MDLSYRLIGSGYLVLHTPRVSTMHHAAGEHRPDWRVYYYYTRNGIWVVYRLFPPAMAVSRVVAYLCHDGIFFLRAMQVRAYLRGCLDGVRGMSRMDRHNLDADSLNMCAKFAPNGCRCLEEFSRISRENYVTFAWSKERCDSILPLSVTGSVSGTSCRGRAALPPRLISSYADQTSRNSAS